MKEQLEKIYNKYIAPQVTISFEDAWKLVRPTTLEETFSKLIRVARPYQYKYVRR